MTDTQQLLEQEIQDLKNRVQAVQLPEEMLRKVNKDIVALERSVALGSYDEVRESFAIYRLGCEDTLASRVARHA